MMKKALAALAITFSFFAAEVSAQQQEEANKYLEYTYEKRGVKERKVVPYPPLREADVIYAKRVLRILDTREKKNIVMQWPKNPLNQVLYNLVTQEEGGFARVKAYKNDSLQSVYTPEELVKLGGIEEVIQVQTDPNDPFAYEEQTVVTPLDPNTIKKFYLYEEWLFDKQRGMFFPRIIAIAPVFRPMVNGVPGPEMPMFWASWAELRPVLINEEIFNPVNDAMRLTYYDFFEQRYFSSYIVKESNSFDYAIGDFPEYKDSPMEALYESERIKEDLFNWEHDLWEW